MLSAFADADAALVRKAVYGLVGNQAGVEFCAFKEISDEFADVYELMTNPDAKFTPPEKADRRYALCAAVVYHLWRGRDAEEERRLIDGFYRIAMKLSSDFASLLMTDAMIGADGEALSAARAEKLFTHPRYTAWAELHGKALNKRLNRKGMLD